MSFEVIPRTDIDKFIKASIPEHLDVFRDFFGNYVDGMLNHSKLTDRLEPIDSFYNLFGDQSLFPLLTFTPKLAAYSKYDIRNLVALSSVDVGPAFFQAFFSHFYDRFEIFYEDNAGNRYEHVASVLYTDEGAASDDGTFTDQGIGHGVYALGAYVIFTVKDLATVQAQWTDVIHLLSLLKPGRLVVYQYPTLDIRINQLDSLDPECDPSLLDYVTPISYEQAPDASRPLKLITDAHPPLLTDALLTTDNFSTLDRLNALATVRLSGPTFTTFTQAGRVSVVDKGDYYYYVGEFLVTVPFTQAVLVGGSDFFGVQFEATPYFAGFNRTGALNLRFSMKVRKGVNVPTPSTAT